MYFMVKLHVQSALKVMKILMKLVNTHFFVLEPIFSQSKEHAFSQ